MTGTTRVLYKGDPLIVSSLKALKSLNLSRTLFVPQIHLTTRAPARFSLQPQAIAHYARDF